MDEALPPLEGRSAGAELLLLAQTYSAATGASLRAVGYRCNSDKLFVRLAEGGKCRPRIAARALGWLAENWPGDVPWPDGIVRPQLVPSSPKEEGMPLVFEEDDEQREERIEAEKEAALFEQRARIAAERAALARRQQVEIRDAEKQRIRDAMDLLECADGMLLGEVRAERAVAGTRLVDQRVTQPSLGGQTPANMELLSRQEASREQAWKNEQRGRERWIQSQEETIKQLQAGQSPENQAQIAAQFRAQRGS